MSLDVYHELERLLDVPSAFIEVLPILIEREEAPIVLSVATDYKNCKELAELTEVEEGEVKRKIETMFARGLLDRKEKQGRYVYKAKSFVGMVRRYLAEGRDKKLEKHLRSLREFILHADVEEFRTTQYPICKVIPLNQAIAFKSLIIPYELARDIVKRSKSSALLNCICRETYKRCSKPLDNCMSLDDTADILVERGVARRITLEEAEMVLEKANEYGLVQQSVYSDWVKGKIEYICSCCSCCCHFIRAYLQFGVKQHLAKSGFMAEVDSDKCSGCGTCVRRCLFKARRLENGKSFVEKERCYGCGLCVTTCPVQASSLKPST